MTAPIETTPPAGGGAPLADDRAVPSLDDLRGRTPDELNDLIVVAAAHIQSLHQDDRGGLRTLSEPEKTAMKQLVEVRDAALKRLADHKEVEEVLSRKPEGVRKALDHLTTRRDPFHN